MTRKRLGAIGTLLFAGTVGVVLGYGNLITSQSVEMWRKVGQTIHPVPSTLALDAGSTTVSTLKLGQTGTQHTEFLSGTCNLTGMDESHTATTSAGYDCAVTGVQAGDVVFVQPPTTVPATNIGWRITGASASSTSGYITLEITNLTGDDAVPSVSNVGSSTQYLILSTQ